MGGTRDPRINQPDNLLTLCGSGTTGCHGWVESHPTWATAHGWSVPRWDEGAVPVWTWRGWVVLIGTEALPLVKHAGVEGCTCGCRQLETTTGVWDTPEGIETP